MRYGGRISKLPHSHQQERKFCKILKRVIFYQTHCSAIENNILYETNLYHEMIHIRYIDGYINGSIRWKRRWHIKDRQRCRLYLRVSKKVLA